MAKVTYSPGIELTTGALDSRHILITRQKKLTDTKKNVTKICETEMYLNKNKRNYKIKPARGAELAHLQHFGEASRLTTALMQAYRSPETATPEQLQKIEDLRLRFQAQLKGTPDPQAPLDRDGKPKTYYRFDNFIRAMIYIDLKK